MSMHADWGESAVAALRELCADDWEAVRDWATFEFRRSDVDSMEIRKCLKERLHDPDLPTRGEAICALARRHDFSCLTQLINILGNLDAWDDYYCLIEAAHEFIGSDSDDERSPQELRDELLRMCPSP